LTATTQAHNQREAALLLDTWRMKAMLARAERAVQIKIDSGVVKRVWRQWRDKQ